MDNINIAISEPSRSGRAAISNSSSAGNTGKYGIKDEAVSSEKQSFSDSMEKVAKQLKGNNDASDSKVDGKNLPVSENSTSNAAEDDRTYSLQNANLSETNASSTDSLLSPSIDQLLRSGPESLSGNSSTKQSQLELSQLSSLLPEDTVTQAVTMSDIQVSQLMQTEVANTTTSAIANSTANSTATAIGVAAAGISPNRQAMMPEIRLSDVSLNGLNTPLATQQAANTDVQTSVLLPASNATLDDIALLAQNNKLSAQLSGLSGQQSTNPGDNQLSNLLQATGLSADATNSTLSASLNNASNNVTPLNFSAMTQVASPVSSQASSQAIFQGEIAEPFGRPAWSQSMGKQVLMMVNQNINSAEIRLNPANLGPIEMRIDMSDDQINVSLNSRSAAVREAMEMALPKLREMFENNGLNLAGADISQHSFAEQREQNTAGESNLYNRNIKQDDLAFAGSEVIQQVQLSNRMVDYYI